MINLGKELKYDKNNLIKSYNDALKDKEFKSFTDKIKVSDDIKMKYTSSLEESKIEYNNCLNCNSLGECKNKIMGYAYLPRIINNGLTFTYKPCKYKNNMDKKYAYLNKVKYYNLPKSYMEASFSSIDKRIASRRDTIKWLNNFINNPSSKGLYLSGSFGSGKTYLIVATLNELAKRDIKSAIVFWPEFLRDLKSSFNDDYEDKIEYIKNVDLLLIDDLGAEVITPWSRDEILCPILQYRMDNNLPIFITSNFNLENLEQHLSQTKDGVELVKAKRIIERIKYLTEEIEMVSKNMRNGD